jgi:transcriptional regulator with XRE-family HTH domain
MPRRRKHPLLVAFGLRLRLLRNKAGLTQEKLSFRADLERSYVGQVERGERNVTLLNVCRLAKALRVRPADVLDFPDVE